MMTVLLGCVGLTFDVGKLTDRYRQAQNAADAAALGAAYAVSTGALDSTVTAKARLLVRLHNLPTTDLTLTYLGADGAVTTTATAVTTVTAVVRDTVPTIFMQALGVRTHRVSARAEASTSSLGTSLPAMSE
jgi:Flp pilus assembly protein TadG